jgi:biopolymer transport protein TolQ
MLPTSDLSLLTLVLNAAPPVQANADMSMLTLVLNASLPVQFIMLLLVVISVLSWTFIFSKRAAIKRALKQTANFEETFWGDGGVDLNRLAKVIADKNGSQGALARIFLAGTSEFSKARRSTGATDATIALDGARRAMRAEFQREMDDLDSHLNFLASVGSVSPYIGLLGTVWGIMHAFVGLANVQQATLASVAPGIAEALIATAIGLFAAIPAVVAYNRYTHDIDRLSIRFETFVDQYLNVLQLQVR